MEEDSQRGMTRYVTFPLGVVVGFTAFVCGFLLLVLAEVNEATE